MKRASKSGMRKLKALHLDRFARAEVGAAAAQTQSGDNMDFGLLCFERGRLWAVPAAAAREAVVEAALARRDAWKAWAGERLVSDRRGRVAWAKWETARDAFEGAVEALEKSTLARK